MQAFDAPSDTFDRNMGFQDRGEDVRRLQAALNDVEGIQVAVSGPGSPGQETHFFGPLTRRAVIAFQEMYAEDVLHPIDLVRGTGFVGPLTRAKLNDAHVSRRAREINVPDVSVPQLHNKSTSSTLNVGAGNVDVYATDRYIRMIREGEGPRIVDAGPYLIQSVSPRTLQSRDTVSVVGSGLSDGDFTVHFGDRYYISDVRVENSSIEFTVPDISPGVYDLAYSRNGRVSDTVPIVVTKADAPSVVLREVQPGVIEYGETVRLLGRGFTKTDNIIETRFGTIKNVIRKNNTTLEFTYSPPDSFAAESEVEDKKLYPVWARVINTNGISEKKQIFDIQL